MATSKKITAPKMREMPPNPPTAPSKELHVFPNPSPERDYVIQFQVPEFTCHCPLTGQPDFAHFTIDMIADKLCVELKSLKMYFWSYRDEGAFHEKVTNTILDDIIKVTHPRFIGQMVCARRHLYQCGGRACQEGLEAGTARGPTRAWLRVGLAALKLGGRSAHHHRAATPIFKIFADRAGRIDAGQVALEHRVELLQPPQAKTAT